MNLPALGKCQVRNRHGMVELTDTANDYSGILNRSQQRLRDIPQVRA
jgi:hypothetical protein